MQLLHSHAEGNEPQVIHVVYRETLSKSHTRKQIIPHHSDDNIEQDMDARRLNPELTDPFCDPPGCRERLLPRSEGTSTEISSSPGERSSRNSFLVPEPAPAEPTAFHPSFQTIPHHGGSTPLQYDAELFFTPEAFHPHEVVGGTGELRYDFETPSANDTLLLSDAAYPEYIHDTLTYACDLPPSRKSYHPLWTYALEFWFPPTEGFQVVEDWDPQVSLEAQQLIPRCDRQGSDNGLSIRPKISLAVLDSFSPTEPFLLVNIHSGMPVNDLSRAYAKTTLEETFETLRACSFCAGFKTLCVVSAVGAKWNMVVREPGWLEGEMGGCSDYIGQLEEEVTTSESYRVMGYCFEELKKSVLRRREERWSFLVPTRE